MPLLPWQQALVGTASALGWIVPDDLVADAPAEPARYCLVRRTGEDDGPEPATVTALTFYGDLRAGLQALLACVREEDAGQLFDLDRPGAGGHPTVVPAIATVAAMNVPDATGLAPEALFRRATEVVTSDPLALRWLGAGNDPTPYERFLVITRTAGGTQHELACFDDLDDAIKEACACLHSGMRGFVALWDLAAPRRAELKAVRLVALTVENGAPIAVAEDDAV